MLPVSVEMYSLLAGAGLGADDDVDVGFNVWDSMLDPGGRRAVDGTVVVVVVAGGGAGGGGGTIIVRWRGEETFFSRAGFC